VNFRILLLLVLLCWLIGIPSSLLVLVLVMLA